ncbi:MAG: hypothetical protein KF866_07385 [Phycisphaeraceae bacterium]|nr:hypothetical protein [Phycisphaeraceae bacterium]MCW5753701.1 hypothetical protein [Phycisphaeraceae bacterium]
MSESFRALCSDFYVNSKLSVKLELPRTRETVLEFFERIRRQFPDMEHFRRYKDELALESPQSGSPHRWAAVRTTSVRGGVVNPERLAEAYSLHRHLLEASPYYLTIRPLDIDYFELLYGFDFDCRANHDGVIFDALMAGSPLGSLLEMPGAAPIDCQPMACFAFGERQEYEAQFEVKSRRQLPASRTGESTGEPISVYITIRRIGPFGDVRELPDALTDLAARGEDLVQHQVVPRLLVPLRDAIAFGSSGA